MSCKEKDRGGILSFLRESSDVISASIDTLVSLDRGELQTEEGNTSKHTYIHTHISMYIYLYT